MNTHSKEKIKVGVLGFMILLLLWFIVPVGIHLMGRVAHGLSKPDATICVAGHDEQYLQPIMVGKSLMVIPETRYVCDREGPNPNYASEMARWQSSK